MTRMIAQTKTPAIIQPSRTPDGARLDLLMSILELRRPHESNTEKRFVREYIETISGAELDGFGNVIVRIPGDGENILWSSHTDTVHFIDGKQSIRIDKAIVTIGNKSLGKGKSNCLGADDAAGVWLMLEMIEARKPGLYIFHRGEEHGGLGSRYIVDIEPALLSGISAAIALDRKGQDSVITEQGHTTASIKFALSLANALRVTGLPGFKPDDSGIFTDTANYASVIPECSNLSVGYENAHSTRESLNVEFLVWLRSALIKLDSSTLAIVREPEPDFMPWTRWYESANDPRDTSVFDTTLHYGRDAYAIGESAARYALDDGALDELRIDEIARLVKRHPRVVAQFLLSHGFLSDELYQVIYDLTGELDENAIRF
jgi:di/tripeptidase